LDTYKTLLGDETCAWTRPSNEGLHPESAAQPPARPELALLDPQVAREHGIVIGAGRLHECLSSTRWTRPRRHDDPLKRDRHDGRSGHVQSQSPQTSENRSAQANGEMRGNAVAKPLPATDGHRPPLP